jgi:hypothetical protein
MRSTESLSQNTNNDSTTRGSIDAALRLPNGARFYRCALQINPFQYVSDFKNETPFPDEESYNTAIIEKCLQLGIEVIGITDHYRIRSALSLWKAACEAGLYVFPGFEAVTKDGVHFLCLFDRAEEREPAANKIERVIGDCGVHDDGPGSPVGKYDVQELLSQANHWGAICIAAHVTSGGGLLRTLSGQPAINAWRSGQVLAASIPGATQDTSQDQREILENRNPAYRRERPTAILNAQDVNGPDDLAKPGSSCWIKMSEVSVEGLRQAFLDPDSRIRLTTDALPEPHTEFVAITWQAGFLDGSAIHFNENLNALIGGRGTGKTTAIESLRYVLALEPLVDETTKMHQSVVKNVLKSGTKVSLLVRSHTPAKREYLIERTVPNPPIVRSMDGQILAVTPSQVVPGVEVFGQHELSELTRSPEKLTKLLERFVERDGELEQKKGRLSEELSRSRAQLLTIRKEIKAIDERLGSLPALEETLKRFREAGLEARLQDQSLLVKEEQLLKTATERLNLVSAAVDEFGRELPIDRTFLSDRAIADLPGREILQEADRTLEKLSEELESLRRKMRDALARAEKQLSLIGRQWMDRRSKPSQDEYQKVLRELQKTKVDGEEFIRLRRQIEELRPLRERKAVLQRNEKELEDRRRAVVAEWEDTKATAFRKLDRAAKKVSRRLADQVRVKVAFAGNREPLCALLRKRVQGRLSEGLDCLRDEEAISLTQLVETIRQGAEALSATYRIPPAQARLLADMPPDAVMEIEELDLPSTTEIALNVAPEGQSPVWRSLEELSTGQKATAVLLLLLLESDAPLVIDQPEDDLDNRFITEGIVPRMRDEKRRRQFVFATHNANIPVLGDAELIVGMRALGGADQGQAEMPVDWMGSIDSNPVRELVEELLEGGKTAFEMRRLKYGF